VKRRILIGIKLCLGLAIVGFLLAELHFDELGALLRSGQPGRLWLSVLAFFAAMVGFQALRLHWLVRHHTGGLWQSYKLFFIGALFNNLLPSNVGGDAVRLLYLHRMGAGVGQPLALLLLHRISGLGVLLCGGFLYVLLRGQRLAALMGPLRAELPQIPAVLAVGVLALLAVTAVLLLRRSRLVERLATIARDAATAIATIRASDWWVLIALTVGFHALRLLGLSAAVSALGSDADALDLIFVLAVAAVAALLPISIAGLGLVEGSLSLLLVAFGVGKAAAIAAALINRAVLLLVALLGALVYFGSRENRRPLEPAS